MDVIYCPFVLEHIVTLRAHSRIWCGVWPCQPTVLCGSYSDRSNGHGLNPVRTEPPNPGRPPHASSGGAKPR